jgi:Nucleoside-diphosphate-sugar pyrophosphorylase involved in lipopolysaccharide biosynthesis/translation initiation factor 2B, gamma/epsilon subunits (eIF-2Bgamma/eIF-2Bepsilon)
MNYAIIAAGEGSRLVKEGVKYPKPLVKLNGISLMDRLISIFLKNNATSISLIINEEMKEVQEHVSKIKMDIPFHVIIKSTPGSMHSFFELSRFLSDDKFCLTTIDTVFKEDEFSSFIQAFISDKNYAGMMAVTGFIDDEKPLYVDVDPESMNITGFYDEKVTPYISGGIYCLCPQAIQTLEKCLKTGVLRMRNYQRQLICDGLKLKAYPFEKILDVDHAEDIGKAEKFLNS